MADPASGLTGQDKIDYDNGQRATATRVLHFRSYEILSVGTSFIPRINRVVMGGIFDT